MEEYGIPKMFFINKVDDERVDYQKVLQQLKISMVRRLPLSSCRLKREIK